MDGAMGALILFVAFVLGVVLAILWICLPFAVFGVKDKLNEAIDELREIRAIFERIDEARK